MISKIYNLWLLIKSNLFFIPAVISLFSFAALMGVHYIEKTYLNEYEISAYFFNIEKADAKSFITTLLSAMITLATLAISITMLVLSIAASQLGPRILKAFMGDRTTKYYNGYFFSVVMGCFTLSLILHDTHRHDDAFQITANIVFVMSFLNLFVLLGFLNHVAQSCIADNVIIKLSNDLKDSIGRIARNGSKHRIKPTTAKKNWPKAFSQDSQAFRFYQSGYVQNINYDDLLHYADKHDLHIQIDFEAGYYLIDGQNGVRVLSKKALDKDQARELRSFFIIGRNRTPTQDVEYSIRHLVEIALRALSPGINDAFTAITVIDHLASALVNSFENDNAPQWLGLGNKIPRIHAHRDSDKDLIYAAFDQIRHNARTLPHVLDHLDEKIKVLKSLSTTQGQKKGLNEQIKAIKAVN